MKTSYEDRVFQLWEYRVSHGSLFGGPRHMKGLDLVDPTITEVKSLSGLLRRQVPPSDIRIIVSDGQRFPVIAANFRITENEDDIFDSPFD
jgi:hypothetical protein